jgi:hypothetical protein
MRGITVTRRTAGVAPAVLAWRAVHALIAVGFLASIVHVWWCALSGRRGPLLRLAIAALIGEGAFVAANRGDCPLGPVGDRVGDPVPLFELVLPPRAARRAVPVLGAVTVAGIVLLAVRSRRAARTTRIRPVVVDTPGRESATPGGRDDGSGRDGAEDRRR